MSDTRLTEEQLQFKNQPSVWESVVRHVLTNARTCGRMGGEGRPAGTGPTASEDERVNRLVTYLNLSDSMRRYDNKCILFTSKRSSY